MRAGTCISLTEVGAEVCVCVCRGIVSHTWQLTLSGWVIQTADGRESVEVESCTDARFRCLHCHLYYSLTHTHTHICSLSHTESHPHTHKSLYTQSHSRTHTLIICLQHDIPPNSQWQYICIQHPPSVVLQVSKLSRSHRPLQVSDRITTKAPGKEMPGEAVHWTYDRRNHSYSVTFLCSSQT